MFVWRHSAIAVLMVVLVSGSTLQAAGTDAPGDVETAAPVHDAPGTADVVAGEPALSAPVTTLLDGAWNTGFYTSTEIGPDGSTHVAYFADGTGSVRLASCQDPCVEPTVAALTERPGVGVDLVRHGGGLAVSFLDLDTRTVQVVTCETAACASPRVQPVASVAKLGSTRLDVTPDGDLVLAAPGQTPGVTVTWCRGTDCRGGGQVELPGKAVHTDLAVAPDGAVWVAHQDDDDRLAVVRCRPHGCTPRASSHDGAAFPGIAVSPSGDVAVSYHATTSNDLHLISCPVDADCREVVVDRSGDGGYFSSVAYGRSGAPIIAHRSESLGGLLVADCQNPRCTSVANHVVDLRGRPGDHLSLAIDAQGVPRIAHHDALSRTLRLTVCADSGCAVPPGGEHGGQAAALASGDGTAPLVAWRNPETMDLRLSPCPDANCGPGIAVDSGGDVGLRAVLLDTATTTAIHQDARDGQLRLVRCDEPTCPDPTVAELPTPDGVVRFDADATSDGGIELAATTSGGVIHRGRCEDTSCVALGWVPVGVARPGAPVATTATNGDEVAIAYADGQGAVLVACGTGCTASRYAPGAITAVEVTSTGDAVVAVARDASGQVTVARCDRDGCREQHELPGRFDHVAISGSDDGAVIAAADGDDVQLFTCQAICQAGPAVQAPATPWDLEVGHVGGQDLVLVLMGSGPWLTRCDATTCAAMAGDGAPGERPATVAGQQ